MKVLFYIVASLLGFVSYSVYSSGGTIAHLWLIGVALIALTSIISRINHRKVGQS